MTPTMHTRTVAEKPVETPPCPILPEKSNQVYATQRSTGILPVSFGHRQDACAPPWRSAQAFCKASAFGSASDAPVCLRSCLH